MSKATGLWPKKIYPPPPQSYSRGLKPDSRLIPIPDTPPGETVEISIGFTAPTLPCSCISYWKMSNAEGELLFPESEGLSCLVSVIFA